MSQKSKNKSIKMVVMMENKLKKEFIRNLIKFSVTILKFTKKLEKEKNILIFK